MSQQRAPSRAEAAFVIACVRQPETLGAAELAGCAAAVTNWQSVVNLAVRHRVAALVLRATDRAGLALPSGAREALHREALTAQAVAMLLDAQLGHVAQALAAAGVPVVVLKGPGLARILYAESGLRPYADLDLSVRESDQDTAAAVLAARGFVELDYEAEIARRAHATHVEHEGAFHRLFAGVGDRALIELHTDPLQMGLRPVDEAARWARAVALPGVPGALMLGAEDQVVQLCVHAQKHGFSRLIWLKDLDLLLRAGGDGLNWSLIHEVAAREGVVGSVWYALRLCQRLLATPLPSAAARLRPGVAMRWIYRVVWPESRIMALEGFLRRRAVQFHIAESWRGMLPSLVLMGRRGARANLLLASLLRR